MIFSCCILFFVYSCSFFFFFFNGTATTEIYTLSLHDALPIAIAAVDHKLAAGFRQRQRAGPAQTLARDRKSTRLNSSHITISYAVFCLKKKKKKKLTKNLRTKKKKTIKQTQ